MQHAIQMGLATVGALSILSHALSAEAATIRVNQREANDSVAQTVSKINENDQLSLKGTVGGSSPVSSTTFPARSFPIDGKDLYQVILPEQQPDFGASFVFISDSSTRMKVWADRNGDRKLAGDELVMDLSAGKIGRKTLPAGAYIVEVTKTSALATASNYRVEINCRANLRLPEGPIEGRLVPALD